MMSGAEVRVDEIDILFTALRSVRPPPRFREIVLELARVARRRQDARGRGPPKGFFRMRAKTPWDTELSGISEE